MIPDPLLPIARQWIEPERSFVRHWRDNVMALLRTEVSLAQLIWGSFGQKNPEFFSSLQNQEHIFDFCQELIVPKSSLNIHISSA